jgi:hypothetical protein
MGSLRGWLVWHPSISGEQVHPTLPPRSPEPVAIDLAGSSCVYSITDVEPTDPTRLNPTEVRPVLSQPWSR